MKFSKIYGPLGLLCSIAAPVAALNFMALGDSITEFGCWRAYLQAQTQGVGITDVDWIGSMTDTKTCSGVETWDPNHEGHSGYLAIDIANQYLQGWLAPAAPDIAFFHLGTNDITQGHSTEEIIAAFGTLVDLMRESNPAVKVIVSFYPSDEIGFELPSSMLA